MQPVNKLVEAVLEGIHEGIVVIDAETQVVLWNRAAAEMFPGLAKVGGAPLRLVGVTRDPEINAAYRFVLESGCADMRTVEVVRGERRFYQLHINPIGRPGRAGCQGAVGIFFDTTELHRLERVRRDFFANLSHELRTPLTAILAYIETLIDGAIDDPANAMDFLRVIQKHALRMQVLVGDITDLSAIESGEVTLQETNFELAGLVDEVMACSSNKAEANALKLTNQVPRGFTVRADRGRLEQVLANLIDNAIKFNVRGGRVDVLAERDTAGGAQIVVQDSGTGIPEADLPRVFERFYRADRSRSRDVGGSGLGLAIAKHLVLAHGGEITVASRQGKGTTFRIWLPAG
jgi:two-component system phosphate regulon sensor histidine kinase PhoR